MLDLRGRRVLVVGAGMIAARKIESLRDSGADDIVVVAPQACAAICELHESGSLRLMNRHFEESDVSGAWLIVAATDSPETNITVCSAAHRQQTFCLNAQDADQGSAAGMAVTNLAGDARVAVSGNSDPGRATAIRDYIATLARLDVLPTQPTRRVGQPQPTGKVILVGAGPGDASLLTLRALDALRQADVLVVDRLAPSIIWKTAGEHVEVIDAGKAPGRHSTSQDEINAVLVARANEGKIVVRIKGGDPFVLGRGGEEAAACIAANVAVEVVPGITSAVAVPGAQGIPLTHRGITSSFIVASAHEGPEGVLRAVADAPHSSTLALLMGASALPRIAVALIEAGRDPQTPVAVLESGWTPQSTIQVAHLGDAAEGNLPVTPPAVVVVGDVVRLHSELGTLANIKASAGHA